MSTIPSLLKASCGSLSACGGAIYISPTTARVVKSGDWHSEQCLYTASGGQGRHESTSPSAAGRPMAGTDKAGIDPRVSRYRGDHSTLGHQSSFGSGDVGVVLFVVVATVRWKWRSGTSIINLINIVVILIVVIVVVIITITIAITIMTTITTIIIILS